MLAPLLRRAKPSSPWPVAACPPRKVSDNSPARQGGGPDWAVVVVVGAVFAVVAAVGVDDDGEPCAGLVLDAL